MAERKRIVDIQQVLLATPLVETVITAADLGKAENDEASKEATLRQMAQGLRAEFLNYVLRDSLPRPNWTRLIQGATDFLIKTSRHTVVLALLTEALLQEHGWQGLQEGLELYREMIKRYSTRLRPVPIVPTDRINRYKVLLGLTGPVRSKVLEKPLLAVWNIPLCQVSGRRIGVDDIERIISKDRTIPSLEDTVIALAMLDPSAKETWFEDADKAKAECELLHEAIRTDFESDPLMQGPIPSVVGDAFGNFKSAISQAIGDAKPWMTEPATAAGIPMPTLPERKTPTAVSEGLTPSSAAEMGAVVSTPAAPAIQSRAEALSELRMATAYFEKFDPHSLVKYHLRRAERWITLSLPEVLSEVMVQGDTLTSLLKTMAVLPANESHVPQPATSAPSSHEPESPVDPSQVAGVGEMPTASTKGFATSRDGAIEIIRNVVRYIENVERHSFAKFPLAFALEIANMPLSGILERMVSDSNVRAKLMNELGVLPPQVEKK